MCEHCDYSSVDHAAAPATRRHFLTFAGAAAAGLVLPGSGFAQKAPPKLENKVSPGAAENSVQSQSVRCSS